MYKNFSPSSFEVFCVRVFVFFIIEKVQAVDHVKIQYKIEEVAFFLICNVCCSKKHIMKCYVFFFFHVIVNLKYFLSLSVVL